MHPDAVISLDVLARVHQANRDFSRGEPLFISALEIRKQLLGNEHLDCAISMHASGRRRLRTRQRPLKSEPARSTGPPSCSRATGGESAPRIEDLP